MSRVMQGFPGDLNVLPWIANDLKSSAQYYANGGSVSEKFAPEYNRMFNPPKRNGFNAGTHTAAPNNAYKGGTPEWMQQLALDGPAEGYGTKAGIPTLRPPSAQQGLKTPRTVPSRAAVPGSNTAPVGASPVAPSTRGKPFTSGYADSYFGGATPENSFMDYGDMNFGSDPNSMQNIMGPGAYDNLPNSAIGAGDTSAMFAGGGGTGSIMDAFGSGDIMGGFSGIGDSIGDFGSAIGDSLGFGKGGMFEGTDWFGDGGVMGGIGSIAGAGLGINSAVQAGKQYKNQLAVQDYMVKAANEDRKGQYQLTNDYLRDRHRADGAAMGRSDRAAGKPNDREATQLEYKSLNI